MTGETPQKRRPAARRQRRSLHVLAAVLGVLAATIILMVWSVFSSGERLPPISRQQFEAAKLKWRSVAIENYDIVVNVVGRQSAVYRVEVRDGEVATATRNGHALRQPRTWGSWTVDGMFGTMEIDFNNIERVASGDIDPFTPRVSVFGRFDAQNGLPLRFRRVMSGFGQEQSWARKVGEPNSSPANSLPEATWEIVSFRSLQ